MVHAAGSVEGSAGKEQEKDWDVTGAAQCGEEGWDEVQILPGGHGNHWWCLFLGN